PEIREIGPEPVTHGYLQKKRPGGWLSNLLSHTVFSVVCSYAADDETSNDVPLRMEFHCSRMSKMGFELFPRASTTFRWSSFLALRISSLSFTAESSAFQSGSALEEQ
ncbi:MAG: hypothetical protein KC553_05255, partial [Nitrospina sp.]|nr:hypothetical protein [Nitrospina sp.]